MGIIFRYLFEGMLTLLAVFFFTTVILLMAGAPPFVAYYHIFKGALGSWIKFAHVIKVWIPLRFVPAASYTHSESISGTSVLKGR